MTTLLFLEALVTLWTVRLGVWVLPWRLVSRPPAVVHRATARPLEAWTAALRSASRYVPSPTCLVQALALRRLLARRGCVSVLNLGVRNPPGGRLQAHAWLEVDGRVILGDPGAVEYQRLHPRVR